MVRVEHVPCPICACEETRVLFRQEHFAMGRCRQCGLVRQNPRCTADWIREVDYDGAAQEGETFFGRPLDREGLQAWQSQPLAAYEAGVAAIEAQRTRRDARGLWLDVGASTGQLLVAARAAGWRVGGVELGSGQVRLCRDVHGIDLFHGALAEAAFPDGHAEVVSYRHVLEHVHDVSAELLEAHRVLEPRGLLLVEVPNYAGVKYALGRLRTALRLSRSYWHGLNVPEHVYYFTIHTLERLLGAAGFRVLSWSTYGRTRRRRGGLHGLRGRIRDALRIGNKLRVVATAVEVAGPGRA